VTAGVVPDSESESPTEVDSPEPGRPRRWTRWLGWVLVAGVLLAASRLVRPADLVRAWSLVRGAGWAVTLVVIPTLVAMMLDALGWRAILRTLGAKAKWRRLVELRISVEAIVLALPGGSVAGEAAKVAMLGQRIGVRPAIATASLALTKLALVGSDALYLTCVGLWATFAGARLSPLPGLLCFGGAAFTAALAGWLALVLRRSAVATSLARRLAKLPIRGIGAWIDRRSEHFAALDGAARAHFALPLRARLGCIIPFALEWFVEGLETFIILRCLGVHIGFGSALVLDAVGSLLRAVVFFVPAGLGIQDAAQMMLLAKLGISDPLASGTAFVVIKRTKEVFWIAIGLLLLAGRKVPWRRAMPDRSD
jgi:uncharacterized membrane protein YbhN (UPF0104 family)